MNKTKFICILICLVIAFSFSACNNVTFTETENFAIVANDGTEYTYVGYEGNVACFGEWDFIGRVKGEKTSFTFLLTKIKSGMYSINGEKNVLGRRSPVTGEFDTIYIKSGLLKTELTLDNCIRFGFLKGSKFNEDEAKLSKGITECEQFINEIKSGQTAEEAGLYNLDKQEFGEWSQCYVYGYVCGVVQEDVNIVIPLQVLSYDDKIYTISTDHTEYILPQEWLDKLTAE